MANGQQVSERNLAAFLAWASSKSVNQFREYVHNGKLKRADIAHECGFGRSAIVQNPAIKSALAELEESLRENGVLPPSSDGGDSNGLSTRGETKPDNADNRRLAALEQENAALRVELRHAKSMLSRYQLLSQFIEETGRMPR